MARLMIAALSSTISIRPWPASFLKMLRNIALYLSLSCVVTGDRIAHWQIWRIRRITVFITHLWTHAWLRSAPTPLQARPAAQPSRIAGVVARARWRLSYVFFALI